MRVVVCLQERVDPAAARALARLLFASEPEPSSGPEPELRPLRRAGDGRGGPHTTHTPSRGRRVEGRRRAGGKAAQDRTA